MSSTRLGSISPRMSVGGTLGQFDFRERNLSHMRFQAAHPNVNSASSPNSKHFGIV